MQSISWLTGFFGLVGNQNELKSKFRGHYLDFLIKDTFSYAHAKKKSKQNIFVKILKWIKT